MSSNSNISKPPTQRQLRVGEEIRHALSSIFLEEDFYDPAFKGTTVTVSEVKISPDLKNATVFVSLLGQEQTEEFAKSLNKMAPQLRFLLGKKVKLKSTPRIVFRTDKSFDYAHNIESIIERLNSEKNIDPDE
ncbi:30S ribosome-binding factor RbfA [Rickettsiales bacterium]|nr:30S ribosome-binding factor RbfA [Rickettsiales bacterium]